MRYLATIVLVWLAAVAVHAQSRASSGTCLSKDEMRLFIELARYQQCRARSQPEVTADPISIVVDRKGRIFTSGSQTMPLSLQLKWCNYTLSMQAALRVQTAEHVEREWGLRLRAKAAVAVLLGEALHGTRLNEALDAGLLLEPAYFHLVNLNLYLGLRSFGLGLGVDVTNNFGVALIFGAAWVTWRANPAVAGYFSF